MSIAPRDFWNRLVKVGITDASECRKLTAAVRKANGGEEPSDVRKIAKRLVRSGILTTYQAKVLLSERPLLLRRGPWLVQDASGPPPLSKWKPVRSVDENRRGLLFSVKTEAFSDRQRQWLNRHQSASHPALQRFEETSDDRQTYLFSELPTGCNLDNLASSKHPFPPDQVCRTGIDLCHALQALHERSLVHGQVRCDRVWVGDNQRVTLLRDPSRPPTLSLQPFGNVPSESDRSGESWLDELEEPFAYLAPELADADRSLQAATDIYSLGCLLYRMSTGQRPVEAETFEAAITAHTSQTPSDLAEAVRSGADGDPLLRVIAFAMAKRPEARFADADQFAKALETVLRMLPQTDPLLPETNSAVAAGDVATDATSPANPVTRSKAKERRTADPKSVAPPPRSLRSDSSGNRKVKETSESTAKEKKRPAAKEQQDRTAKRVQPAEAVAAAGATEASSQIVIPATPPSIAAAEGNKDESQAPVTDTNPPQPPNLRAPSAASVKPRRKRKRKKNQAVLLLGGMSIAVLMLMIILVSGGGLGSSSDDSDSGNGQAQRKLPANIPPVTRRSPAEGKENDRGSIADDPQVDGYELIADERLLFVPPYAATSEPSSLEMLPPGPAVIATFRVRELLQSDAGTQIVEAFAPGTTALINSLEDRTAIDPSKIERCTIALFSKQQGWPEVSIVVQLAEPVAKADLLENWDVAEARTPSGATVYAGDSPDSDAYYLTDPDAETVQRFAIGSVTRIQEVGENQGAPIPLPRALQTLWDTSSEQSDVTILVTPNFLFADGRQLLQASIPEAVGPLKRFLIPDASAALLTATLQESRMFVETRLTASGGTSASALSRDLQAEIESWPSWAEEFIVDSVPDVSWRLLAIRLPAMMRFVADQFRFGVSEDVATANAYLPVDVVPQVSLASVLALNTPPAGASRPVAAPAKELSIDEMLDREMTVSFEQESLEFALNTIVEAFNEGLPPGNELPPARIIGGDLQLMGITQNQQVRDFDKEKQPLRKVLTDLVLGANPDQTAAGPDDPKQALVWVVAEDSEGSGGQAILITTRQAAKGKYELPAEFVVEP